ncbi:hypothetical protein GJ744_005330 [Endocarpon pusillum]|uniref:Uncharacterized protein n=1 Tax=Endocarpon pusillum TaxID=364733 RepID=A0A8H7APF3_9EURO|nr:hypothetical protein GJ744_005330 [Endocarpon pusillum]
MTNTDEQRALASGTSSSVSNREEPDPNKSPAMEAITHERKVKMLRQRNNVKQCFAITHQRNVELRRRDNVKQFFTKVKTIKSVWDKHTCEWLAALPLTMGGEAIPLFESNIDEVSEDYQLYPSHSWLTQGVNAEDPDIDFYKLSDTELREPKNRLFMPLGRLFVNAANGNRFNERTPGKRARLTRWTGYEVFVTNDLGLWIVFDGRSLASHAPLWYPVPCGLTTDFGRGIARLLPSLSELEHATSENAWRSMKTTYQTGFMVINEVETSEVRKIEAGAIAQDTAHTAGKKKSKVDVGETPLTSAIKEENEDQVKRLLELGADVNYSNIHGQMPLALAIRRNNDAIVMLLLNTGKVNLDLEIYGFETLFKYLTGCK